MRLLITFLCVSFMVTAQNDSEIPYYEIPEYSETYTAGTVAARQVDALGFRFYHATEGLKDKDLAYKANVDGRSTEETIMHVYDLSLIVLNSTLNKSNARGEKVVMTYKEAREKTLKNLKQAADVLRASKDISKFMIVFGEREIPFWNNINGPIADAIWHSGQIAISRRTTGNPINSKVNHFSGTVRD